MLTSIRSTTSPAWFRTLIQATRCRRSCLANYKLAPHILAFNEVNLSLLNLIANYPATNSKDVKALDIPMPKLLEQTAIAKTLSDMDTGIVTLETKLSKTSQLNQDMMHNLLPGRMRLV